MCYGEGERRSLVIEISMDPSAAAARKTEEREFQVRKSDLCLGEREVIGNNFTRISWVFSQKIMLGLWKDLPEKIHHKVYENWISTILLLAPVIGTYSYIQHFKEHEKLEHRF